MAENTGVLCDRKRGDKRRDATEKQISESIYYVYIVFRLTVFAELSMQFLTRLLTRNQNIIAIQLPDTFITYYT